MTKQEYQYYLKISCHFCIRCQNINSGKDGLCGECLKGSMNLETPINFKEKKDGGK